MYVVVVIAGLFSNACQSLVACDALRYVFVVFRLELCPLLDVRTELCCAVAVRKLWERSHLLTEPLLSRRTIK